MTHFCKAIVIKSLLNKIDQSTLDEVRSIFIG
jgi:hypothetical protein